MKATDFVLICGFESTDEGDEDAHFYDKHTFTVLVPVALPFGEVAKLLPDFDSVEATQVNKETGVRETTFLRISREKILSRAKL